MPKLEFEKKRPLSYRKVNTRVKLMQPRQALGIEGDITREKINERYTHFKKILENTDPQEFIAKKKAYVALLKEIVNKEQNTIMYNIMTATGILCLFGLLIISILYLSQFSAIMIASNILLSLIISHLVTDFLSGWIHLSMDHLVGFNVPILGSVARDFNFHHLFPEDLTHLSFIQIAKPTLVSLVPMAGVLGLICYSIGFSFGAMIFFWVACFSIIGQFVHRLAHMQHEKAIPNRWVAFLQKYKLILNPDDHRSHHQKGELTHFCIFSGVCNPLINYLSGIVLNLIRTKKSD